MPRAVASDSLSHIPDHVLHAAHVVVSHCDTILLHALDNLTKNPKPEKSLQKSLEDVRDQASYLSRAHVDHADRGDIHISTYACVCIRGRLIYSMYSQGGRKQI